MPSRSGSANPAPSWSCASSGALVGSATEAAAAATAAAAAGGGCGRGGGGRDGPRDEATSPPWRGGDDALRGRTESTTPPTTDALIPASTAGRNDVDVDADVASCSGATSSIALKTSDGVCASSLGMDRCGGVGFNGCGKRGSVPWAGVADVAVAGSTIGAAPRRVGAGIASTPATAGELGAAVSSTSATTSTVSDASCVSCGTRARALSSTRGVGVAAATSAAGTGAVTALRAAEELATASTAVEARGVDAVGVASAVRPSVDVFAVAARPAAVVAPPVSVAARGACSLALERTSSCRSN